MAGPNLRFTESGALVEPRFGIPLPHNLATTFDYSMAEVSDAEYDESEHSWFDDDDDYGVLELLIEENIEDEAMDVEETIDVKEAMELDESMDDDESMYVDPYLDLFHLRPAAGKGRRYTIIAPPEAIPLNKTVGWVRGYIDCHEPGKTFMFMKPGEEEWLEGSIPLTQLGFGNGGCCNLNYELIDVA